MSDSIGDFLLSVGIGGKNAAISDLHQIIEEGKKATKKPVVIKTTVKKEKPSSVAEKKNAFAAVREEINARKQVERIRRQSDARSGRDALAKHKKIESDKAQASSKKAAAIGLGIAGGVVGAASLGAAGLSNFMTGGTGGVMSMIPLLGGIMSAANDAIESAGREYISAVNQRKSVSMSTRNFSQSAGGANEGIFRGTGLSNVEQRGTYAELMGRGISKEVLLDPENIRDLSSFARAQGVGSIQELLQRMSTGTLRGDRGVSNSDIGLIQSAMRGTENRWTADVNWRMVMSLIRGRRDEIGAIAGSEDMARLSSHVSAAASAEERENDYQAEGAAFLESKEGRGIYDTMYKNRRRARRDRQKGLKTANAVNDITNKARQTMSDTWDAAGDISEAGNLGGASAALEETQRQSLINAAAQRHGTSASVAERALIRGKIIQPHIRNRQSGGGQSYGGGSAPEGGAQEGGSGSISMNDSAQQIERNGREIATALHRALILIQNSAVRS